MPDRQGFRCLDSVECGPCPVFLKTTRKKQEDRIRKLKVHGNNILCEDFTPNMKVGAFTDALTFESKKKLIPDSNFGQEFMTLYRTHKTNMHIVNIAKLMHKMELLRNTYEAELMKIRRKGE